MRGEDNGERFRGCLTGFNCEVKGGIYLQRMDETQRAVENEILLFEVWAAVSGSHTPSHQFLFRNEASMFM